MLLFELYRILVKHYETVDDTEWKAQSDNIKVSWLSIGIVRDIWDHRKGGFEQDSSSDQNNEDQSSPTDYWTLSQGKHVNE